MDSAHIFPELRASCNIYNDGAVDYAGEEENLKWKKADLFADEICAI